MLHADRTGSGPTLVLVHGFTQTRACWGSPVDDLATDHSLVLVDAPDHGRSVGIDADLDRGADLVVEAGGPATYLGYSMGGRLCLHAAIRRPDAVRGLVLLGATAGIDDDEARRERRAADDGLADRIEEIGTERFVDEWLGQPLFADLPDDAACRAERLENSAEGLARSLRATGTGTQVPLWDRLTELTMPVLAMAGERDQKFRAEAARIVAATGTNAETVVVPDAGHAAHLERPEAFVALLRGWLARHGL